MCFWRREKDDEPGTARSRELDKIIRADEKRMQREVKLLLLGTTGLPLRCNRPPPPPLLHRSSS